MQTIEMTVDEIHSLAFECLIANGCDEANATAVAATIASAERDGSASHGLYRVPEHVAALRSGAVNGSARPQAETLTSAAIRLDGDRGFAPVAIEFGIPLVAQAASELGVAVLLIRNSFHIAALWPEVEALAEQGLAGLACTVNAPMVAPFGATRAFFSTNPISFAWPRPGGDPYVFDMATAAKSAGDIGIAARDGEQLEPGVGLDTNGNPTTDAAAVHRGGVILPFGGYKGSAIATMIELLAAGLVGDYFSYQSAPGEDGHDVAHPAIGGQFILAMSPDVLAGPDWAEQSEAFLNELQSMPGVRLPGSRRFQARTSPQARPIHPELFATINSLTTGALQGDQ